MDRNTEKTLRIIIQTCIFLLPATALIVASWLFFPYVTGKNFAFRALVEVLLAAYIPLALARPKYRPKRSVLLITIGVFVGIVGVANIFGENPYNSFWSNFERMDGFITLAHMAIFALIAGSVFTKEKWVTFWRITVGTSAIISATAILQYFTTDKSRLDAILGNPIYLAVYMLFHIFIMLFLLARNETRTLERRMYVALIAIELLLLFLTATRGAALGLVVGIFVACVGMVCTKSIARNTRRIAGAMLAIMIVLGGAFIAVRGSTFVQETPKLARFANVSLSTGTVQVRFIVWGMALEGFKDHPLLGWGQGNFDLVFAKHFDPQLTGAEEWYDRAHNVVFDWLIAAGALGLLAYLGLFVTVLYTLYRVTTITPAQKWAIVGLLVAYGIQNLTVFDTVVSYLLFFAILAFLHTHAVSDRETSPRIAPIPMPMSVALASVIILSGALWYCCNASAYTTNTTLMHALIATARTRQVIASDPQQGTEELQNALELYTRATQRNDYGVFEVREHFSKTAITVAQMPVSDDIKKQWLVGAATALSDSINTTPEDPRPVSQIAQLYDTYGVYDRALAARMHTVELAPNKPINLLRLGATLLAVNRTDESLVYMQEAYELVPEYENARVFYAVALLKDGNNTLAQEIINTEPSIRNDPRIQAMLAGQ